jgi:tetratricopeptide (TPR) repeat protein
LALAEKQYEAAQSHQLRALAIWEKQLEPGHPKLAYPLGNLGDVALERGDAKGALEYYQRALKILEGAHGPEHLRVGGRLVDSGQALLELRSPTEALAPLERALKIFSSSEGNPLALAGARFTLARALWDVAPDEGRDRPRAHELASLARAAYAEANYAEGLDEVDAWLREHSR